jgi:hypothetical protein
MSGFADLDEIIKTLREIRDSLKAIEAKLPAASTDRTGTYLKPAEAAKRLGVSADTLTKWRSLAQGPAFAKLGHGVRYAVADLDTWLASKTRGKV